MQLGGFLKQSFIDFPKTLSAVIFTNGCNLNCWYCHNQQLINGQHKCKNSLDDIYKFLESRKGFLEGVVISGGEPTLQYDLEAVVDKIKSMGFKVKLDTNGTNPKILEKLLPKLNYVAMDIKNSFENYEKIVGKVNIENIKKSIEILKNSCIDYEFRTTFTPDISLSDIKEIAKSIKNAKCYFLQTYIPQTENMEQNSQQKFDEALKIVKEDVPNSYIR
ncbi:MAG: anaerobic ribonucleoside-triphosphate reductase activating protein [Clostridia bacterium]|nr:anaerobic ribonucleoside-triphosphate reductase activating protein [Clostridia bacterium]